LFDLKIAVERILEESTHVDVGMTPRSTGENFGYVPMVECEGGQNPFGVATEIQQLDYRLGGVVLPGLSQGALNGFG
jgi:hypothetical protein